MSKRLCNGCNAIPYDTEKHFICCKCGFENREGKIKELHKQIDKSYKVIDKLVLELSDKDRKKFYKHLNIIIDTNIEIEGECNQ